MSCVASYSGTTTNINSGAYFKNVTFSNSTLYNYNIGARSFGTYGSNTYYVYLCKPEKINFSYGTNSEVISIQYS